MSLTELGAIGEFFGAIGMIASLAYLGVQVSQVKKANAREGAFELIHSFQTVEFTRTMQTMFELDSVTSNAELEQSFEGRMGELLAYFATWESIGILVHKGQISLELVSDFFSHPILHSWAVAEEYMNEFRTEVARETPWEWFQWLAERIQEKEAEHSPLPAYVEFRNWKG